MQHLKIYMILNIHEMFFLCKKNILRNRKSLKKLHLQNMFLKKYTTPLIYLYLKNSIIQLHQELWRSYNCLFQKMLQITAIQLSLILQL